MQIRTLATVLSTALVASPLTVLADEGQFIVTPSVGIENFDSSRHVGANNKNGIFGLSGEYQFSNQWGSELNYTRSYNNMDVRPSESDVGYDRLSVNGLYHFTDNKVIDPYVKLGVGHDRYNYSGGPTDQNTDIDAGVGVRFHVTGNLSIRPEVTAIHELDTNQTHGALGVGFSMAFGGASKAVTPQPAPVAVIPPAAPKDSDGDGVPDDKDKCPNTPRGREVDADGCEYSLHKTEEIRLDINFANDKADITEASVPEVEKAARFLKHYSNVNAVIAGHTDATGSHAHNVKLSQRRADAVRNMLIARYNIDASRLSAIGYAESDPIATNKTAEGRAQNRRVIAVMKADVVEKR